MNPFKSNQDYKKLNQKKNKAMIYQVKNERDLDHLLRIIIK